MLLRNKHTLSKSIGVGATANIFVQILLRGMGGHTSEPNAGAPMAAYSFFLSARSVVLRGCCHDFGQIILGRCLCVYVLMSPT